MKKVAFKQIGDDSGFKLVPRARSLNRSDSNDPEMSTKLADLGLLCPLSKQIFRDPVTLPTGITYERRAIELWLERNSTCPVTGQKLNSPILNTNISTKQKVFDWAMRNRPSLIDQNKMSLKELDDTDISFKSEFGKDQYSRSARSKDLSRDLSTIQDDYNPRDSIQARYNQNKTPSDNNQKIERIPTATYFGPNSNSNNDPQIFRNNSREIRATPNLYDNDTYENQPLNQNQQSPQMPPPAQGYTNMPRGLESQVTQNALYSNHSRNQQEADRDMAYAMHLQDEQQRAYHNQPYMQNNNYNQYQQYPQQQGYYNHNGLPPDYKQHSHFQSSYFSNPASRYTIQFRHSKYSWITHLFFFIITLAWIAGIIVSFYFNSWRPISLVQQPLIGAGPVALQKAGGIHTDQFFYEGDGNDAFVNDDIGRGSNIKTSYDIRTQWYTIFTSLWIFSGVYSLVVGVSTMWLCVNHLKHMLSWWKLISLFLICGIVGNLAGGVFAPKYVSTGAPTLVFGLLGALVAEMIYHFYLYRNIIITIIILIVELGLNIVINLPPSGNMWGGIFSFIIGALLSAVMFRYFRDRTAYRSLKGVVIIIGKISFALIVLALVVMLAALFGKNKILGARNNALQNVQCPEGNAWWDCSQGLSLSCSIQHNGICMDLCNLQGTRKSPFGGLRGNNGQGNGNGNGNTNSGNGNGGNGNSGGGGGGGGQGFVPASQGPISGGETGPVPLPNQIAGNGQGFVPASRKL